MAYRNKTYICFDGDRDMKYYRMMTAWSENEHFSFEFFNAHDLNTARDTSQEESIKRQLRTRLINSKIFIILIGENTKYLTKFVKWQIETALDLEIPIICVNLNGNRHQDDFCPPSVRDKLAVYIPFKQKIIEYAMKYWPQDNDNYRKEGKKGPFFYNENVYKNLGL